MDKTRMKGKKIVLLLMALCACLGTWAQNETKGKADTTDKYASKDIVKKGWNFGPLPVVGWDSDLGFQYGACIDIFNYGNGSHYPSYDYKINFEASAYTRGSMILRSYGDIKSLIPNGKLFYDCTYFNARKFDFFGYNGYSGPYTGGDYQFLKRPLAEDESPAEKSAMNWMHRSQFRLLVSLQHQLVGNLHWAAGLAYYNIHTGRVKLDGYENQWTLYELYRQTGLIRENEAKGGNVLQFKAGLVFDTRNHDSDPTRGLNLEATFTGTPDIIDRKGYSHIGFTFVGSHYVPLWRDRLTLAYRLGVQTKIWGEIPYYFANNLNMLFFRKLYTEGLGGNASVRGINRNSVLGNGLAWLNAEVRWRIVDFRFINQNWCVAVNPFFDMGQVIQPYRLDEQKQAFDTWKKDHATDEIAMDNDLFYSGDREHLHCTAGMGLKLIMNRNLVVSVEFSKALDKRDGKRLWNNIGFNYLF